MLDQLSKNITRCGLSNSTLNYLRVSVREEGGCSSAMSCALSCLMPGWPGVWVGCKAGFAKGILQRGCRELWGSGSAESHTLTVWLGSVQHRCLPVRGYS